MKYLKKFNNASALNEWVASDAHLLPNVVIMDGALAYNVSPLYIEALEDDMAVSFSNAIEYKMEGGDWAALPASTATPSIAKGGRVYFRASGITPTDTAGIGTFTITKQCKLGGNIMSMAHGAEFYGKTAMADYQFLSLFANAVTIVDAENLLLPATTLSRRCYRSMFSSCTSLVNAPALPATTLAEFCYQYMFQNCTSLVNAPALPATTLVGYCYQYMFQNCTSLVNAPALPATTLAEYCYYYMFSSCTSLVNAPALPATKLKNYCYGHMFRNCTSLVNAPALPATSLSVGGCMYMFSGCTSLVKAPDLSATSLIMSCYNFMFYGCTSLAYIKAMFTTAPSSSYTNYWVSGVSASGTFVKNAAATWENTFGPSAIPTGWAVQTASE